MEYLDFDLDVAPGKAGKYAVSVVQSAAGEAHGEMRFPYDRLALKNKIQALQIALLRSGGSRRAVSTEDRSVEELGRDLYKSLFAGEISSRLQVTRTIARQQGRGVRIRLRISAPELLGLPWEYLYDSTTGDYLALAISTPVVRYMPIAQPILPLEVRPPLRILAMTAGPRDLGELDGQRERQRLETAIDRLQQRGLVELKWVEGERWEDLQEALWSGPWHVFHYVGHGGYSQRLREGVLYLTGDDGNARELAAHDLARLLGDHDPLRLAVLNSCETAEGAETDIFSSTAAALVRRGTPAVVAMQFEITDDAAIQFSRMFYAAIAHGMPVDSAVAEGRKSVALQVANTYEWGTPVLFMRSPDGVLFQIPQTDEPAVPATEAEVEAPSEPEPEPEPALATAALPEPEPAAVEQPRRAPAEPDHPVLTSPAPSTAGQSDVASAPPIEAPPATVHPPPTVHSPPPPSTPPPSPWASAPPPPSAPSWFPNTPAAVDIPSLYPQRPPQARNRTAITVGIVGLVALLVVAALSIGRTPQPPDLWVFLSPGSGPPGSTFTVSGQGFQAYEPIFVSWGAGFYDQQADADANGNFQATMTVPAEATSGDIQVTATNSSGRIASTFFTVETPVAPATQAPSDPFLGTWHSIDKDGSNQTLSFDGAGSTRNVSYFDDRASVCGPPDMSATLFGVGTVDGNTLSVSGSGQCQSGKALTTVVITFTYDASTNTLTDSGKVVWTRP